MGAREWAGSDAWDSMREVRLSRMSLFQITW